jgi:hypothetical protein
MVTESAFIAGKRDWLDYGSLFVNLILAVIAGSGVVAAWFGLPGIRKQAEAAIASVQVLRKSERPWLLLKTERVEGAESSAAIVKNCGRTPAQITAFSDTNWDVMKAGDPFPPKPIHGKITACMDQPNIILPEESSYILTITDHEVRRRCGSDEVFEKVKGGELQLYIFGSIHYRDIPSGDSATIHQTAWCVHYLTDSPNTLSTFGLPGYNYHT